MNSRLRLVIVALALLAVVGCRKDSAFVVKVLIPFSDKNSLPTVQIDNQSLSVSQEHIFSRKDIQSASLSNTTNTNDTRIELQLNSAAAKRFAELTSVNIGNRLGVFIQDKLYAAPIVQSTISSGRISLTVPEGIADRTVRQIVAELNSGHTR